MARISTMLKSGAGTAPEKFEALVERMADVQASIDELDRSDGQLTASAYIEACLNQPGASAQEVAAIEKALTGPEAPLLRPSIQQMIVSIKTLKRTSPLRKTSNCVSHEGDAALARLPATSQSLCVVAAKEVARRWPEIFGQQTKLGDFEQKVKALIVERDELRRRVEAEWTRADIEVRPTTGDDRENGLSKIVFVMSRGEVALSDGNGVAERLTNWVLTRRNAREAA